MVKAGEMTKEDLMAIYVKGIQQSARLDGKLAQGTQALFARITEARKGVEAIEFDSESGSFEEQLTEALVTAISRGISLGHLDPTSVYEAEERPSFRYS